MNPVAMSDWPLIFLSGTLFGLFAAMTIMFLTAKTLKAYARSEDLYDNDYEEDEDEDEDDEPEEEELEPAPSPYRPKERKINVGND